MGVPRTGKNGWRGWLYESEASQRQGDDGCRRWAARAIVGPESWEEGSDLREDQRSLPMIAYTIHSPSAVPRNVVSKWTGVHDESMMAYLLSNGRVEEDGTKVLSHVTFHVVVVCLLRIHSECAESGCVGWQEGRVESKRKIGEEGKGWIGEGGERDQRKQACSCRPGSHCLGAVLAR